MNKRDVTPIIVNGELSLNQKRNKASNDGYKEPKKNPLIDLLLTLVCIGFIGYGVYTLNNKDKSDDGTSNSNTNVESNVSSDISSNISSNSNSNIKNIKYEEVLVLTKLESVNLYTKEDLTAMNTVNGLNVINMSNNAKMSLASKVALKSTSGGKVFITEEELDNSMKALFGDIVYTKRAFRCGKDLYTHNQETKNYYVMEESLNTVKYSKYDYVEKSEENDTLIYKNYVVYTDGTKSWTINNIPLTELVNGDNMKEKLNLLKYYEYKFNKVNDNYILSTITIK